ncbi:MAG: hypothetical protein ACRDPR_11225 [Nocardioidaceae bacterium]
MSEMFGKGPAGDESPEEYRSNDQSAVESSDTGTTYDQTGEPESTPHDRESAEADQADANAASSAGVEGEEELSGDGTGPANETGDPV